MSRRLALQRALVLLTLGVLAAGSLVSARRARPFSDPVRFDHVMVPRVGAWVRLTETLARTEVNVDELTTARYSRGDGSLLQFTVAASGDARRHFEMHYPDVCHEIRGDQVNELGPRPVVLAAEREWPAQAFTWRQASRATGALCLYGLVFGGRPMPHSLAAKWTQLSASVLGTTLEGHMLRVDVFAPSGTDDRLAAAIDFLSSLDATLDAPLRGKLFGSTTHSQPLKETFQ